MIVRDRVRETSIRALLVLEDATYDATIEGSVQEIYRVDGS